MKFIVSFCLLGLVGCSSSRGPASFRNQSTAHDSIALGNIQATAVKNSEKLDTCFEITVKMKGVKQEQAEARNWTVAWVDEAQQYHLVSINQRRPASLPQGGEVIAPYGAYQEWTNTFHACAPQTRSDQVKTLILTPKSLPYNEDKGLNLTWK